MTVVGRGGGTGVVPPLPAPDHPQPKASNMRKRKLDRRSKVVLSLAAAAAVLVNAGAAYAYWRLNGAGTGVAVAGTAIELKLQGRSDDSRPLYPGGTTNLTVEVTNQNDFPIKITSVVAGDGAVSADPDHRAGGCRTTGVVIAAEVLPVAWEVPRNTIGVFTVPDGLKMTNNSDSACQGATFTIPVRATGVSAAT